MRTLLSKVQHNNFEIGEFVEERERTFDEVISSIESFPWEEERKGLAVSLTNPSVTIQKGNSEFLKLALFYNGKFVLHYFNNEQILFTKSFINFRDSYSYINAFFEQGNFDTSNFKKENTWLQHNLQHFVSQDFQYKVTTQSIKRFLMSTSSFNFVGTIVLVVIFMFVPRHNQSDSWVLIFLFLFYFIVAGGGMNLLLFFNYYNHCKNQLLVMSKGSEIFYYGSINSPVKYNKSQIIQFTTIQARGGRNAVSGFAFTVLQMKDAPDIELPNLLVGEFAMVEKLKGIPHVWEKRGYPSIT